MACSSIHARERAPFPRDLTAATATKRRRPVRPSGRPDAQSISMPNPSLRGGGEFELARFAHSFTLNTTARHASSLKERSRASFEMRKACS